MYSLTIIRLVSACIKSAGLPMIKDWAQMFKRWLVLPGGPNFNKLSLLCYRLCNLQ